MRWKRLRRRFSVLAPSVSVRSHTPWPLRWLVGALLLGFSGAVALWAFETGRSLAGLDRGSKQELEALRSEVRELRQDRDKARAVADTADSLLKTEKVTLERLTEQLRKAEASVQTLKADLGFYERLLPAPGDGVAIRGFQVEVVAPGKLKYLLLAIQSGKQRGEFKGRYELQVTGTQDGRPWQQPSVGGSKAFSVTQSARFEGMVEVPANVSVKNVQARILDAGGVVKSTQTARF
jgi:hypothetical protein